MLSSKPICKNGESYGTICRLCPKEKSCEKFYKGIADKLLFKKFKEILEEPTIMVEDFRN